MTLDNIKEEILNSKNIIILTHEVPDGDAIGSSLAMYIGLKQLGKDVDIVIPKYSKIYSFLPCINKIKAEGKIENYDLAIALDCGDIKRLNGFSNYFENANCKISIDHHEANTMFADYNFVNPTAPACSQILNQLIVLCRIHLKELKATDLINIEEIFIKKPKIELNNKQAQLFLNGVKLNTTNPDEIYRIYRNEQFLGIGVIKNNLLKRDIIIIDNY